MIKLNNCSCAIKQQSLTLSINLWNQYFSWLKYASSTLVSTRLQQFPRCSVPDYNSSQDVQYQITTVAKMFPPPTHNFTCLSNTGYTVHVMSQTIKDLRKCVSKGCYFEGNKLCSVIRVLLTPFEYKLCYIDIINSSQWPHHQKIPLHKCILCYYSLTCQNTWLVCISYFILFIIEYYFLENYKLYIIYICPSWSEKPITFDDFLKFI